jgi:hypothetical protein
MTSFTVYDVTNLLKDGALNSMPYMLTCGRQSCGGGGGETAGEIKSYMWRGTSSSKYSLGSVLRSRDILTKLLLHTPTA